MAHDKEEDIIKKISNNISNGLNKFFLITEKLKSIKRKGWEIKSTAEDIESVADHSYAATAIAMIISDLEEMNTEKVMKKKKVSLQQI